MITMGRTLVSTVNYRMVDHKSSIIEINLSLKSFSKSIWFSRGNNLVTSLIRNVVRNLEVKF